MLRELCAQKNENYFICTSNVDGHFAKAGFSKDKIYEVHGSIHHAQCIHNDDGMIWPMHESSVEVDEAKFIATKMPVCPECGCVSRPNIMMFYEALVKRFKNATLIRINPKDSDLNPQLGISLKLGGLEALNQIL